MSKSALVTIPAHELELYLPKPPRAHDALDLAARCHHACPVCKARFDFSCSWAQTQVVRAYQAHDARRELVTEAEAAKWLARFR